MSKAKVSHVFGTTCYRVEIQSFREAYKRFIDKLSFSVSFLIKFPNHIILFILLLKRHKMKNWRPGQQVNIHPITVDGTKMRLMVFPNGYTSAEAGYVSLFVENLTEEDLELGMPQKIKVQKNEYIISFIS